MPHSVSAQESTTSTIIEGAKERRASQAQMSQIGRSAIMSNILTQNNSTSYNQDLASAEDEKTPEHQQNLVPPKRTHLPPPRSLPTVMAALGNSDYASSDGSFRSGASTAPGSPRIQPVRQNSGTTTPRTRPPATTLNIPGMTRSKVSPDGRIAERDVASKLVIIMVGLPARGKSYITKKLQRYLSWQQHNTKIFNVGNRRRVAAGVSKTAISRPPSPKGRRSSVLPRSDSIPPIDHALDDPTKAAHILLNGVEPAAQDQSPTLDLSRTKSHELPASDRMDQNADFFAPTNEKASKIREQVALSTLDELLDYLLHQGGSVGILDATNSTIERRQTLFKRIKEVEPKLGILFIESICEDKDLLEANMRLKLSGPDYKDKDPAKSLADFKKRVAAYESAYVPLGKYEEDNHMQYIQMIDVGRKVIHHQLKGFLSGGISSYLTTFNLAPRQIWITRHGMSQDNALGRLGGNSDLTEEGEIYSLDLYTFITKKRKQWLAEKKSQILGASFPPQPGEDTPPYPDSFGELDAKNFCVWTSMLKRSIETAAHFEADDDYDVKNWEMLNELNAGSFEGSTYEEIMRNDPVEFAKRKQDKLHYIYPGVGGEGYLQVISRLRDMVREIERITDHVLIIGHRSVARVLMAYFMDLTREDIADLDVPLGMLYVIEPKPYGIDFHAYKYDEAARDFNELLDYKPQKEQPQSGF